MEIKRTANRARPKAKPISLLQQLHEPPKWFGKPKNRLTYGIWRGKGYRIRGGRIVKTPALTESAFMQMFQSKSPAMHGEAMQILKDFFDNRARLSIKKYFAKNPDSLLSFEMLYSQMLSRQYRFFIDGIARYGVRGAIGNLHRAFNPDHIGFEQQFVRQRDYPGRFSNSSRVTLLFEQIDAFPVPKRDRSEFEEIIGAANLNDREKEILRWRYEYGKPQEEIGDILNISHQRVQQMEEEALNKLYRKISPLDFNAFMKINKGKIVTQRQLRRISGYPRPESASRWIDSLIKKGVLAEAGRGKRKTVLYRVL
jgi:RNA polymerase sigma factor (sigma-70 family)